MAILFTTVERATTVVSALIAALVWLSLVILGSLLLITFLLGAGSALTTPPGNQSYPTRTKAEFLLLWLQPITSGST